MNNRRLYYQLCLHILSIVFIISGLSKALDFFATAEVVRRYCDVLGLPTLGWLSDLMSLGIVAVELFVGIALLLGVYRKIFTQIVLALLSFFTLLTLYSSVVGGFDDCGCFGSFLQMSPFQSFCKNIVLLLVTITMWQINYVPASIKVKILPTYLLYIIGLVVIVFCVSAYVNQPIYDGNQLGVGSKLLEESNEPTNYNLDMEFQTSVYTSNYDYSDGESVFLVIKRFDVDSDKSGWQAAMHTYRNRNIKTVLLTSSPIKEIPSSLKDMVAIARCDYNSLSNLISKNNGIIYLYDGKIVSKWQQGNLGMHDFPISNSNHHSIFLIVLWIIICIIIAISEIINLINARMPKSGVNRVGKNQNIII